MREAAQRLASPPDGIGSFDVSMRHDRWACECTVREVFSLIWPQAGIACHAGCGGCVVEIREGALQHRVHVPWALVEFDRGLLLVRSIYRAGLPRAFQATVAALSLSL